ncbi:MAG: hypothetical protein RR272_02640 [Synergistaceae bacterium]
MILESILEVTMLICFAAAWPAALYKSWVSKSRKGKSLLFLFIVIIGYSCGIVKVLINGHQSYMLIPYTFNTALVIADVILYYRNYRIEENKGPIFALFRKDNSNDNE